MRLTRPRAVVVTLQRRFPPLRVLRRSPDVTVNPSSPRIRDCFWILLVMLLLWQTQEGRAAVDQPDELPGHAALWIALPGVATSQFPHPGLPALFSWPPGWAVGDAAVVILGRAWDRPLAALTGALFGEGAAVLELETPAATPAHAPGLSAALQYQLFEAVAVLRRDLGAGAVVLLGVESFGEAIRQAAIVTRTGQVTPAASFAAAVVVAPTSAESLPGSPVLDEEGWPARARRLCDLIDAAITADAFSARGAPADHCRARLLPPRQQ